jgi:DNA-binding MarR family transcriptional regulator
VRTISGEAAIAEDLGALFARVTQRLIAGEQPLLHAHDLGMWDYVVLTELAGGPAPTQLALARAIGHDKTRLIGVLDRLEQAGLVSREPDPADRRARIVRLTRRGEARMRAARSDVRAMEDEFLSGLTAAERQTLLAVLPQLAGR